MLFSLFGLYILYLGVPILMETPQDKALTYTLVIIVAMIVIYAVIGSITSVVMPSPNMMGLNPYR